MLATPSCPRVLIVDDNPSIHDDFRRILAPGGTADDLDAEAAALFGLETAAVSTATFDLDFALQGEEACAKAAAARAANRPFALAFVDMRMPPGWDGLVTIRKLWDVDPDLHIVICTAHSDRTWSEIHAALVERDRWLLLKKPFNKIEAFQLTSVMTEKWALMRLAQSKSPAA